MKTSKILFNIATVICFIFGALYIFSLVFIPVGIYCFLAAKRFQEKAEHLLDEMAVSSKIVKNYAIFASIACFPLGLVALVAYAVLTSNNVKIETAKEVEPQENLAEEKQSEPEQVVAYTEETEEEKQAKFEKLKRFHEKGIITDEELEMAKSQLFGKKD